MVTWRGSWRVRSSKAEQARVPSSVVTDRSGLIWIIKRGGSPGNPRQEPSWARYAPSYGLVVWVSVAIFADSKRCAA